jgi:hypothetical protein
LRKTLLLAAALAVAGCASFPTGPGVMVLPGSTKTWDQFQVDDADCRNYSSAAIGGKTANNAAAETTAKSAMIGTAVGAAAGGLIGGGQGAAVGAGVGLLGGSAIGADAGNASGQSLQQRYDFAFQQCMYAKGHQVPVARGALPRPRYSSTTPPPPPQAGTPPPPPSGTPPAPPSGYRVN